MASNQVTVLGPHGRRTILKVNPGTSILQIIEDACAKQKIDPNLYDAKHLRRILDASSTIRFSNVPNKAQLELVEASKSRISGCITVNLVTDSGDRYVQDFNSEDNLYEILKHHENIGRLEIPVAESAFEPVLVYTMRRIKGNDLRTTTLRSLGLLSGKCMMRYNKQAITDAEPMQANVSGPLIQPKKAPVVSKSIVEEVPKHPIVLDNGIEKSSESMLTETISANRNVSETEFYSHSQPKTKEEEVSSLEESMEVDSDLPRNCDTQPMESNITDEYPKKEPKVISLGSHDAILFNWDDVPPSNYEEETDEFFELTINELQGLHRDRMQEIKDFETAPLMTHGMRELEQDTRLLSAMARHPVTQLRVCFPDRNVLQASFKPTSKISDVVEFVRTFLLDQNMEFSLFTTMPKKVLDPSLTLVEADCIPKARLYFESHVQLPSYLSSGTLEKKSSFEGASNKVVSKSRTIESKSDCGRATGAIPKRSSTIQRGSNNVEMPSTSSNTKKPKWFKLGK